LYSVPIFTAVTIESQTVVALTDHPNIIGMKDSNGNYNTLVDTLRSVPNDFKVLNGAAPAIYGALCVGAAGGTLAAANMLPDVCAAIYNAYVDGNHELARQQQFKLGRLLDKI